MPKWIVYVVGAALLLYAVWEGIKLVLLAFPSGRAMHLWARAGLPSPFPSDYRRPQSLAQADQILASLLSEHEQASGVGNWLVVDARHLGSAIGQLLRDPARLAALDRLGSAAYDLFQANRPSSVPPARISGGDAREREQAEFVRRIGVLSAWKTLVAVAAATNNRQTIELLRPVIFQRSGELRPGVVPAIIASRSVEALRFAQTIGDRWQGREVHDRSFHIVLEERVARPDPAWRAEMVTLLDRAERLEMEFRASMFRRAGALTPDRQKLLGLVFDPNAPDLEKQLALFDRTGASIPHDDLVRAWQLLKALSSEVQDQGQGVVASDHAGRILEIVSRSRDPRGLVLMQELLEYPIFHKTTIADVHLAIAGLPPLWMLAQFALDGQPASRPEEVAARVIEWDCEVCNGGVLQYFVNSSSKSWRDLTATFELVGARRCTKILQEAVRMLGGAERLTNRERCAAAVGLLSEADSRRMDELASEYYALRQPGGPGVELMQRTGEWIVRHMPEIPESRLAELENLPFVG